MSQSQNISPAEKASILCLEQVIEAIKENKNFLVEAGAGAGKTYTLIQALKYLISQNGPLFLRTNKRIACITYTNVAKDEIKSRTDNHPIIFSETIHAFCWEILKDFQKPLRKLIPSLSDKWLQRIEEAGGIHSQEIIYNLGYPKATNKEIYLHHDDVIKIMTILLDDYKFRNIIKAKFPVVFIDEYQDTNKDLADAMVRNFIETESGPLIGFYGDHWQKIYGTASCGKINSSPEKLIRIGKEANFRSDKLIVEALNRLRPDLPQNVRDPDSSGEIIVFHTNQWNGQRRTEAHWKEDLPEHDAHEYLKKVIDRLTEERWDMSPGTTKILMLTNSVLASEQGYLKVFEAFRDNDDFLKKNDDYIMFLADVVEPGASAFLNKKFGEMFNAFNIHAPKVISHNDKKIWFQDISKLCELRDIGNIGDVIDLLKITKKPRLSRRIEEKEYQHNNILAKSVIDRDEDEKSFIERIQKIRSIPYTEFKNVVQYINEKTLYSTKHGVKGAEFENVLIVFGRGWNLYNWNQMLEWMNDGIPNGKEESFERNRNLFYVACSRPKRRLALLFTQALSQKALNTLRFLFGNNIFDA